METEEVCSLTPGRFSVEHFHLLDFLDCGLHPPRHKGVPDFICCFEGVIKKTNLLVLLTKYDNLNNKIKVLCFVRL